MSTKRVPRSLTLAAFLCAVASLSLFANCSNGGGSSSQGDDGGGVDATTDGRVSNDSSTSKDSPTEATVSCPTGQTACNGKCVDLTSSPTNCGTCGSTCGSGLVCSAGTCALSCGDGGTLTQCSGGCYNLQTDSDNCGTCGTVCTGGQSCNAGSCGQVCGTGSSLCGTQCVNEQTDNANCGGCNKACVAGTVCSAGKCQVTCGTGLSQCGDDGGTSCKDLQSDVLNCGSCGNACATGSVCSKGQCQGSCDAPLVDCAGGCVDPSTSNTFCGATAGCGTADAGGSVGSACAAGLTCVGGLCSLTCSPTQVPCGGQCIDPLTNGTYCGASGDTCTGGKQCPGGQLCTGGVCKASCNPGQIVCNNVCTSPLTDLNHCGASGDCTGAAGGTQCPPGDVCSGGSCQVTCGSTLVNCGGQCIDPGTNTGFCGASGNCANGAQGTKCPAGDVCSKGVCTLQCQAGLVNCNNVCINPLNDPNYCGANSTCSNCLTGQCTCITGHVCTGGSDGGAVSTCQLSCNSNEAECSGACIDPLTDSFNCGATAGTLCNTVATEGVNCSLTPGATCVGGNCVCPSGDVVCSGTCINPSTDNAHCGATTGCGAGSGSLGQNCTTFGAGSTCGILPGGSVPTCNCPTGEVVCTVSGKATCINPLTDNAFCNANTSCGGFTDCSGIKGSNCNGGACTCPSVNSVQEVNCDVSGVQTCINPQASNTNCNATPTSTPGTGQCIAGQDAGSPNYAGQACGPLTTCTSGAGGTECTSTCTGVGQPAQCFPSDGGTPYCANTISDNGNCGTCGNACKSLQSCGIGDAGAGACLSTCSQGQTACPATDGGKGNPTVPYCSSLASDVSNCGDAGPILGTDGGPTGSFNGCGAPCASPLLCSNGVCVSSCTAPDNTFCPGPPSGCADLTKGPENCGACGHNCPNPSVCLKSTCCPSGTSDVCGGVCSNTTTDPNNCGVCGTVCKNPTPTCNNGHCVAGVTYSDSFTQGVSATTQCSDWITFSSSLVGTYSSVTLSGSVDPVGISCATPAVAQTICSAIHNNSGVTVTCGAHSWTVFQYGSAMGVDIDDGPPANDCGDPGYNIRPCIGSSGSNPNWGGVDTATCDGPSQTLTLVCE